MNPGDIENTPVGDLSEATKQLLLIFQCEYTKYLLRDDAFEIADRLMLIAEICKFAESFSMCQEPIISEAGEFLKSVVQCDLAEDVHAELYRLSLRIEDRCAPFFKSIN